MLAHKGGLWLTISSRLICAAWAYSAAIELNKPPDAPDDSALLLDEAARLESVDFAKAITAYEEIVRLYPGTKASEQAASCMETLKRHR